MNSLKKAIMNRRSKLVNPGFDDSDMTPNKEMMDAEEEREKQGLAPEIESQENDLGDVGNGLAIPSQGDAQTGDREIKMEIEQEVSPEMLAKMFSQQDVGRPGIMGKAASKMKAAMDAMKSRKA